VLLPSPPQPDSSMVKAALMARPEVMRVMLNLESLG
jgi:hypothetical protein